MNRLKIARQSLGLSQHALAERTGLTSTAISRYETGKRKLTVETAQQIASAVGIDWVILFEDPDAKQTDETQRGGARSEPGAEV